MIERAAATPSGRKEIEMTKRQEWRMAKKSMDRALKHLRLSHKFGLRTAEGLREWNLYIYFREIYSAHEGALYEAYKR